MFLMFGNHKSYVDFFCCNVSGNGIWEGVKALFNNDFIRIDAEARIYFIKKLRIRKKLNFFVIDLK
jgi:hypothetical protein